MAAHQPSEIVTTRVSINLEHFKTLLGVVKLFQFVVGVILIFLDTSIWFSVIVFICFMITSFWILVYFLALDKKYASPIPWPVMEFYFTTAATFAYAIASMVSLILFHVASGVLGTLNTCAYATTTFYLMKDWRIWTTPEIAVHE